MASAWGSSWGSAWGNAWGAIDAARRRFAGSGPAERRSYLVRGRRYWLTVWELAQLLQSLQADEPVRREEVKVLPKKEGVKPRPVSKAVWVEVTTAYDEEDELILLLSA